MKHNTDLPYVIFELANVHGGSRKKLLEIISEYKNIPYPRKAIKFQALKPDRIALPDFEWFKVYEELYFTQEIWKDTIAIASEAGDVWLDIFDTYGVEILNTNSDSIAGIKLQASVLDNAEVVTALEKSNIGSLKMIINISGIDLAGIEMYIDKYSKLKPAELILQIGFQSYPTLISDTALQKVQVLKAAFPYNALCFADHAAGESLVAQQIPIWAAILGCTYIEKHFCAKRSDCKYDHYSALEPKEFISMLNCLQDFFAASTGPFISPSEANYLRKTYQAPIAKSELSLGSLVTSKDDVSYRRTNQAGMTLAEILAEQANFSVLNKSIPRNSTFSKADFKRATIGVIVACRMKSSRLKKKPLLPIQGMLAVERCLQNCFLIPNTDMVVLATSTLDDDAILKNHTMNGMVKFFQGDPDDVIKRYLGACEKFGIDVVIRVTADCPVVSPEIAAYLLKSHFETGADYTAPKSFAVGSNSEIYNVEALQRVITLLGNAEYSEYMTWYMQNNRDVFKVNLVDLPEDLLRDYRLTLDYPEDLDMFNRLFAVLNEKGLKPTLPNVFAVLDEDPSIADINQHLTLTYKTDKALINKLNEVTRIHYS